MNPILAYAIGRNLHILAGLIATLVVFPLACAVALSGTLMLFHPQFPMLWAANLKARGTAWPLFFGETFSEPAFFLWLHFACSMPANQRSASGCGSTSSSGGPPRSAARPWHR